MENNNFNQTAQFQNQQREEDAHLSMEQAFQEDDEADVIIGSSRK